MCLTQFIGLDNEPGQLQPLVVGYQFRVADHVRNWRKLDTEKMAKHFILFYKTLSIPGLLKDVMPFYFPMSILYYATQKMMKKLKNFSKLFEKMNDT